MLRPPEVAVPMVEARQRLEPVARVVSRRRLTTAPMQHGDQDGGEEEKEESHGESLCPQ